MESTCSKIIIQIEKCILAKLAKTQEEREVHPEYESRVKTLGNNFHHILNALGEINIKKDTVVLAYLKILYEELESIGPWNNELSKIYGDKLNSSFALLFGFPLNKLFCNYSIEAQNVFNACIKILHEKINANNFKYYPSLVEVYCLIVHEYSFTIEAPKVLPISLYLIDDYINSNRVKGLTCLITILKCLRPEAFSDGNYYEVILRSLKNKVSEKDIEITRLVLDSMLLMLEKLSYSEKCFQTDDILSLILEQLSFESNLYRKALLLKFLKKIIEIHRVNCVRRKKLKLIFCDNIDVCSNDTVAEILLDDVLECFETWVKYCWCVWRFPSEHKLISLLIKLLYMTKKERWITKITHLTLTLINLCSKAEQKQIWGNLNASGFTNLKFIQNLEAIKTEIGK